MVTEFTRKMPSHTENMLAVLGMGFPRGEETLPNGRREILLSPSEQTLDAAGDTAMIIIAHPDDEAFVGGTIVKLRKKGKQVVVVALTDGGAGTKDLTQSEIIETRRKEAEEAMRRLDVNMYLNLGFPDGESEGAKQEAIASLTQYMRVLEPKVVIGHRRSDYHDDHIAASEITESALFRSRNANNIVDGIPLSSTIPAYYEMDTQGSRRRERSSKLTNVGMVVRLRPDELQQKLYSFEAHASQVYGSAPGSTDTYLVSLGKEARRRGAAGGYWMGEGLTQIDHGGEKFESQNILRDWLGTSEVRDFYEVGKHPVQRLRVKAQSWILNGHNKRKYPLPQ